MTLSGVVLAGGASRRMGTDKAFLPWGSSTMLQRQLALLRDSGCEDCLVSGRADQSYPLENARLVIDSAPGVGPLAGMAAALAAMRGSHLLVVPIDLPRLDVATLTLLKARATPSGGAVFHNGQAYEPLVCLLPTCLAQAAQVALSLGRPSVQHFCDQARKAGHLSLVEIPPEAAGKFLNCNSPEDWGRERGALPS